MRFKEKNLSSFEDQWSILESFHLLLAIWMALGIGQSLLFPLFQLQDVKPGLFRLNHFPFHKFEAVPTCCPEGVLFPRNLLIIRDICMFHAQLHQKNSTSLPSKAFYFWFQVAMVIVRVITSMMVRFTAIAENNNDNNNNRKIKPFGHRRAPKNEQNATFWPLSPSWGNWLIYVIMCIWVSFCRTGKMSKLCLKKIFFEAPLWPNGSTDSTFLNCFEEILAITF